MFSRGIFRVPPPPPSLVAARRIKKARVYLRERGRKDVASCHHPAAPPRCVITRLIAACWTKQLLLFFFSYPFFFFFPTSLAEDDIFYPVRDIQAGFNRFRTSSSEQASERELFKAPLLALALYGHVLPYFKLTGLLLLLLLLYYTHYAREGPGVRGRVFIDRINMSIGRSHRLLYYSPVIDMSPLPSPLLTAYFFSL